MRFRVAVYGAGIGGLSAAHELCKRPDLFEVHIFEAGSSVGGKAASQFVPGTGTGGRADLPGEHGFRFFPAFYAHLDATLAEIPTASGDRVIDHLVGSNDFAVARHRASPCVARRRPGSGLDGFGDIVDGLSAWFGSGGLDLGASDFGNLAFAMTRFMMSCEQRRAEHYDPLSWYEFCQCESPTVTNNYRELLASLPRTMVAMDGQYGSAYTIGKVGAQLFFLDALRSEAALDRVLDGPTSEAWLRPWHQHLASKGVSFHFDEPLTGLQICERGRDFEIDYARLAGGRRVSADFHICAVPVERLVELIDDDLAGACQDLAAVCQGLVKGTDWMVGAQYFLRRDVPVCAGHVIYPDSSWALTSISQGQFWDKRQGRLGERYGDGRLQGILSVDISNWDAIAPRLGRTAKECTRDEILDEVFQQILDGLNTEQRRMLSRDDVIARHLDENIEFDAKTHRPAANKTPLFVHRPGAFQYRPTSSSNVRNLFLASDYVATDTNLASMEGANEAARRTVGSIVRMCDRGGRVPFTRAMPEPAAFKPFKRLDAWLLARGLDFSDMSNGAQHVLAEAIAEADRTSSTISAARVRRQFASQRRRRTPAQVREPLKRVQDLFGQLRGSLSRAQRLSSRRSVGVGGRYRERTSGRATPPPSAGQGLRESLRP